MPTCRQGSDAVWCWSILHSKPTVIFRADRHLHPLVPDKRSAAGGCLCRAELFVGPPSDQNRLNGAGLIIVNPPWTLENDLSALLPALSAILGPVGKGGFRLDWLPPGDGGSMASFHSPAVSV
jgi:Ribosomal RNA large subunit methyltransferase D, RlmJ